MIFRSKLLALCRSRVPIFLIAFPRRRMLLQKRLSFLQMRFGAFGGAIATEPLAAAVEAAAADIRPRVRFLADAEAKL